MSEDSRELLLVRVSWRSYDLLEGEGHMLEDNVEAVVGCESFKGGDEISVLKLSKQVKRLRGSVSCKCSHIDELNGRGLSNSHFHGATELNIIDLFVFLPRGSPRCPELEGPTRRRSGSL